MQAIHSAVAAALGGKTNTNVITPNTTTSFTTVSGGGPGNAIVNAFYEYKFQMTRQSENLMNVYSTNGSDSTIMNAGNGGLSVRTFDIPSQAMMNDRTQVYIDASYYMTEYIATVVNNSVWIFTFEFLRASPGVYGSTRVMFMQSTDGLVGRAFTAAVQVGSGYAGDGNASVFHGVINGSADGLTRYLMRGQGGANGLRRSNMSGTGVLSNTTLVASKSGFSEGACINLDNTGRILDIARIDSGDFLQQCYSNDWGVTFSQPISAGFTAATQAKVTPSLMKTASRGDMVSAFFCDRGNASREQGCAFNQINSVGVASAPSWNPITFVSSVATQGNGQCVVIDRTKGLYLYCTAVETNAGATTDFRWWVIRDNYTTKQVSPAPWQ